MSKYYKTKITEYINIRQDKIHLVYNGINVQNFEHANAIQNPPVIGFLERQCPEKGLHLLVEAFIILKERGQIRDLKLRIAGGKTADDEKYIRELQKSLAKRGLENDVEFLPNLTRMEKSEFLKSLTVLSVPAIHKEAFGIYVIEALAAGVPVVQPAHGAFPELLAATGGGVLCEPNNDYSLAMALESLILNPEQAMELGKRGREAVINNFTLERMADDFIKVFEKVVYQ